MVCTYDVIVSSDSRVLFPSLIPQNSVPRPLVLVDPPVPPFPPPLEWTQPQTNKWLKIEATSFLASKGNLCKWQRRVGISCFRSLDCNRECNTALATVMSFGIDFGGDCFCLGDDCRSEGDDEGGCNWGNICRLIGCFREKENCLCIVDEDEVADAMVRSLYKRHLIRERRAARVVSWKGSSCITKLACDSFGCCSPWSSFSASPLG